MTETATATTARDQFCAAVSIGPLLAGDACLVLCGQDAIPRAKVAIEILRTGGAQVIVLSGGINEPPAKRSAEAMEPVLLGMGVNPERILLETESRNTREQAVKFVTMAVARQWKRVLVVASPEHSYRAMLTVIQAIREAGQSTEIHVVNVPASQLPWWKSPDGMDVTRMDLLETEFSKIAEYQALGHVASWEDGVAYLRHWEGK